MYYFNENITANEMAILVIRVTSRLGIPKSLIGYKYLFEGLILIAANIDLIYNATNEFYPAIAEMNGVSSNSVQKGLSKVIAAVWASPSEEMKQIFAGYGICENSRPPKTIEFIASVYAYIILERKK